MGVKERYTGIKNRYNGVENRYLAKNAESVAKDISTRVDTWLANNSNYISNAQDRFSAGNDTFRTDSSDWLTTVTTQNENFKKEAENIKNVLIQYKDVFGNEYVNSVLKALNGNLNAQASVINAANQDVEFWSQWESEDDYYTAKRIYGYKNKYANMSYDEIVSTLGGLEDGEEKEWLNTNKYNLVKNAEDFAEKSKYVSTYYGEPEISAFTGMVTDTGYGDVMYDYINRNDDARSIQALNDSSINATFLGLDNSERKEMEDEEIEIFNYLYATQGSEVAYEYIETLTSDLNYRQRIAEQKEWAEYAKENPVGSSVFSVLESPLKGLSYVGQVADYFDDGKIDENDGYNRFSYINSAIRNEVSSTIEAKWGNVGSFAYQTGMSMGDFLFTTVVSGGNEALSLAIMGTGAAADTVIASKDMGLSDNQAFLLGTAAGAIEVATEKMGIDALFDFKTLKDSAGKYILQNFLAEGFEEGVSNIGNTLAELIDLVLSGDESKIKREIYMIMESLNVSEGEAIGKYVLGLFKELGLDVLGGAISGGLMGVGGVTTNKVADATINAKEVYGADPQALVREALEINPGNKLAQKIQGRLDSGKYVSGNSLYRLAKSSNRTIASNGLNTEDVGSQSDVKGNEDAPKGSATENQSIVEKENTGSESFKPGGAHKDSAAHSFSESGGTEHNTTSSTSEKEHEAPTSNEVSEPHEKKESVTSEATASTVPEGAETEIAKASEADVADVQATTDKAESVPVTENAAAKENAVESENKPSEAAKDNAGVVTLESASKKYGAQAGAMISTYTEGQDVAQFDAAYRAAYDMGKSGVNLSYAMQSAATAYLSEGQRKLAHAAGADASTSTAKSQADANKAKANGKTGRRKGVVKGENVSISDLKKSFNDKQNTAYKLLSTYAEATGIDIVLYKSEANDGGKFEGAQGKFNRDEDTIYIDINAGLADIKSVNDLAKYTMMRTFSHEFTHFIEKWSPVWYNEFRKVVFDTLTERGENVEYLIEQKKELTGEDSYDRASREVVAEAMTDILPDANFVENLAQNHKNIFEKLLEKLKEFAADLKAYFNSIGKNSSREANALKEQVGEGVKYVDSIVQLFDKVAADAVENYQMTVAIDEVAETAEVAKEVEPAVESEKGIEPAKTYEHEHFKLTDDAENRNTSIKFDARPNDAVREILKNNAFVWNRTKGEWFRSGKWYGKSLVDDVISALDRAYATEEVATEATVTETEKVETAIEKTAEAVQNQPKLEKQEVKPNVENADNRGTVRQSDADRSGDTRVLDEVQAADVQRDAPRGDSVGSPVEGGQETRRDDHRANMRERSRSRSGDGDRKSGDLRRDDVVSEAATDTNVGDKAAEKLHEDVVEHIAQQSTEQPKGRNFVIGDSLDLPSGEKSRYKANIEAIRLVKQLESEGRYATEAEQVILSKYVGWGGLANAFDERKAEWAKEFKELKELLTEEEYGLARGSTLNAHYTDISVIKAMYDGLANLGFNGGRLLEPSSGVGNFVGAMPTAMSEKVKSWTMVELDGITGLIAKYLYPNADVRIQGFEKANIPDNYMDVAISNVPFGSYAIADKAYPKKVTSAIHNYFFAKSLDKVRPGGIVMFITSSYTMNSKEDTVRRYIMQKADLLGAIRLPDTAFKGNAGTEVVTDILILKKRAANTAYAGEEFLTSNYKYLNGYNGAYINGYFDAHPEMVLGTPTMDGGMYRGNSLTYKPLEGKGSLADQIREAFSHIKGKMDYPATISREKTNFAVERASKATKEDGYVSKDGKIYQNKNGELVEKSVSAKEAERIKGMLEIRDAARALTTAQQQGLKDSEIKKARAKLNKVYDEFVKKYGYLNSPANKSAFNGDPDRYSLYALENYNPETKKATKADIFSKNTIAPNRTVTSAKDVSDGLIVSVNQTGGVDVALIAKLTGKTEAAVTRELIDSRKAFKNRNGDLETAEKYLSGNVRAKLRDAEALVPIDGDYKNNVEALKSVMPEDVGYQDIFVNAGTPWIPNSVYSDFAAYMLGGRNSEWRQAVDVTRNAETGNFTVELKDRYLKTNAANTQKWGTARRSFLDLFDAMLNSKSVVVKDKLDDGSFVVNKDATAAANEKIENIQKEFQEWLWRDEKRRTELSTLYNEVFNSVVTPKYNGDHLTVNGANAMKPLRPHQRNAVQRVVSSGGNTLLAHRVGAGKTYEMAAAAMKLKELGLVKKPMFAVPKSLVAQWGTEFIDFFPTAKLLVAEASDFTAANRKVFMNRIAHGEYDAVIVSYEQFEKLPMSDDFTRQLYQEQIDSVIAAIEEAKADKGDKALSVKDLEKKRKSLQTKIDKLTDKAKDEGNIDFEGLGVDSLFVDEAHNFKNLFYTTSMTNVSGLGNKDGSKRAFDLYTKVRYLQQLNGGRGIVFATATPVMNSMSEMYIMQKYLQPDLLNQLGLSTFDAWAKQFGEVVNGVEIKPSGQGYRVKQSFSRFKNMSELQLLFRNFADVLTDVPGLKIPTMKGGKVNVVVCEPGQFQQDFMKELEKRADNIKNVDPSVDNMLKITSDGRKISYTQRMIDPSLPYEEGCKIFRCADNVVKEYNDSNSIKGTQLIFCDMATPKGSSNNNATETEDIETDMESAQLYDDLKTRLRQGGIPAKEIAFIHEADTDAKKKKLFEDVNDGKVRVLIGSTGKMGVGMNAQKRIVAIHHLDAPWRPGDVEQRDGRAFRQKNMNDEVSKYTYVTEGSFDARLWDILDRKSSFINQVMNGENVGRETEDTGEVTLSAAEVKALASGSPLIMEQVELDTAIKKLESLYRAHISAVRSAKERLARDKGDIAILEKKIASGKADAAARKDTYSEENFSINVGKKKFTDKKEAGVALMAEAIANANTEGYTTIGSFAGFDLRVVKTSEGINGLLVGKQAYPFKTYPGNTTFMISQLIGVVESIEEKVKLWEHTLSDVKADMAEQEKLIAEPFAKQAELDQKRARYNEVMEILNPKEEQSLDNIADDTVQEQSREYLDNEQEQPRTDALTDRDVLEYAANALETSTLKQDQLTDVERESLQIFKDRLSKLYDLQEERTKQGRLYKENQFGVNGNRAEAAKALERVRVLDGQIQKANEEVLSLENKKVLHDVLKKARKVVETEERKHGEEALKRWRDRTKESASIKKYRDRIQNDVNDLSNWILKPNNKDITKHVPDVIKNSVIPFLKSIDFTSKQQLRGGEATKADIEFAKRLKGLEAALNDNIDVAGLYSGYTDLPPYFMEKLRSFIETVEKLIEKNSGEFVINQMTSEELKELSSVVANIKAYVTQINKFHANAMFSHVYRAGDNSIESLSAMASNNGKANAASNFVFWQQMRPAYAFERFGEGGRAIYDGLRRGQANLAFNTQKIVEFTEKTYSEKEVNAWEKEIKTIKLNAGIVKMRVSDMMSFYELSKQPDSLRHMLGEGMRVSTFTLNGKKISDNGHALTEKDIADIVNELTPRQKEVADALQKFMQEQGGAWGNYVSVARFGEELFTNDHYFPINSDGRHLQSTADENPSAASLYALLNMSFTKARNEKANNRIIIYSIFDVFANHMASMAQYNAMALPVLDAVKWFNYQQKTEDADGNQYVKDSVREEMSRVYGVPDESRPGAGKQGYAETFVLNIIKAFNGTEAQGVPTDTTGMNALRRYNMAQVAYNFRVVLQQPLAVTRAALLIDYGSILKGMTLNPNAIKQNIAEMRKYSGIAAWKSLGFYDVNISRGLTDTIKHSSTAMQKIGEFGMKGAEFADTVTWAAMWNACKAEVAKKQHLSPKDAGYFDAVTKLFEDVIYKTQVVDSVLTKNEYLRSKGLGARFLGSFMSEPTTTASMVLDAVDKYNADLKRGMNRQQAWSKNKKMIGRTMYVYGVSAVILAAVQAVADALRDDDEYETFMEKWLEAFGGKKFIDGNLFDELNPINKLPVVADVYEIIESMFAPLLKHLGADMYSTTQKTTLGEIAEDLVTAIEIIVDKAVGEETKYTDYAIVYKLLQAASGITGLPMAAATREVVTAWNNIVGAMAPSLKVKTYDAGEQNEIKYAYCDGYLTFEEAVQKLMEQGLVDNENEAYFTVSGWEAGDGSSRYDAVYEAVRTGASIDAAMQELVYHGYTEKAVISQVTEQIGKWYYDKKSDFRINKQQAIDMLTKYTDLSDEEIAKKVNEWSSVVVTGIPYSEIDDEFMAGNITAERAKEMYARYGSMTEEKAAEKVAVYSFVKEHPSLDGESVSYGFVSSYHEYCEPKGIDVDLFHDVWQYKASAKSDKDRHGNTIPDSKKEKVLEYIDSLELSKKQKDALYYALGWAKSEIREAPWH